MPDPPVRYDHLPEVARVQGDRLCADCGHNLTGEVVRQDPRTQALVCPCPQCGQAEPMVHISMHAQLWLYRFANIVLAVWISFIAAGLVGLVFLDAMIPAYALEKFTTHVGPDSSLSIHERYLNYSDEYLLLTTYLAAAGFGLGVAGAITVALLLPHWPKSGLLLLVSLAPILAAAGLTAFWLHESSELFAWGLRLVVAYMGVELVGGLIGVLIGRPLVRLLAGLILPPRWRMVVAFLWLMDGKQIPGTDVRGSRLR